MGDRWGLLQIKNIDSTICGNTFFSPYVCVCVCARLPKRARAFASAHLQRMCERGGASSRANACVFKRNCL